MYIDARTVYGKSPGGTPWDETGDLLSKVSPLYVIFKFLVCVSGDPLGEGGSIIKSKVNS